MQTTWMQDPKERPDFRAIVIHIANLTKYKGDIETELRLETREEDNPYEYEDPSRTDNWLPDENAKKDSNIYSVLEEPVYNNCSRENSSEYPEEYEVPISLSQSESTKDAVSAVVQPIPENPIEYEIPLSAIETEKAKISSRSGSVSDGSTRLNSIEMEAPYSKVNGGGADDNRYLKLNYGAKKSPGNELMPGEIPEKRYSTLEWRDKTIVSFNSNTLPSQKQRIYQTLEYTAASQ